MISDDVFTIGVPVPSPVPGLSTVPQIGRLPSALTMFESGINTFSAASSIASGATSSSMAPHLSLGLPCTCQF